MLLQGDQLLPFFEKFGMRLAEMSRLFRINVRDRRILIANVFYRLPPFINCSLISGHERDVPGDTACRHPKRNNAHIIVHYLSSVAKMTNH